MTLRSVPTEKPKAKRHITLRRRFTDWRIPFDHSGWLADDLHPGDELSDLPFHRVTFRLVLAERISRRWPIRPRPAWPVSAAPHRCHVCGPTDLIIPKHVRIESQPDAASKGTVEVVTLLRRCGCGMVPQIARLI